MSSIIVNQIQGSVRDAVVISAHLARMAWDALSLTVLQLLGCSALNKLGKWRNVVVIGVVSSVISVFTAVVLDGEMSADTCPAPVATKTLPGAPLMLLSKAGDMASAAEKTPVLEQCVQWKPAQGMPALEQVHAQLECQSELVSIKQTEAEKEELVARARAALGAIRGTTQRCEDLTMKFRAFTAGRSMKQKPADAIVALGGLSGFETIAKATYATLDTISELAVLPEHAEEIAGLQTQFRNCMVKTVREARTIANTLPLTNGAVAKVQRCRPTMLFGVEAMALLEAEKATDNEVLLNAGLLLSEKAIAPRMAPFFGEASVETMADAQKLQVPVSMARSERLLSEALKAGSEEGQKVISKQVLMRLAKHAKTLAEMKQYEAAEWRYKSGAELAKAHGHQQMASSALAQLSYFFSLNGRYEQALEAATESLKFGEDALAAYLQVSLKMSLGELRTEEQVQEALETVKQVKGKLPAEHLEGLRTGIESHLESWADVSTEGTVASCFKFGDVAFALSCILSRIAFV